MWQAMRTSIWLCVWQLLYSLKDIFSILWIDLVVFTKKVNLMTNNGYISWELRKHDLSYGEKPSYV